MNTLQNFIELLKDCVKSWHEDPVVYTFAYLWFFLALVVGPILFLLQPYFNK